MVEHKNLQRFELWTPSLLFGWGHFCFKYPLIYCFNKPFHALWKFHNILYSIKRAKSIYIYYYLQNKRCTFIQIWFCHQYWMQKVKTWIVSYTQTQLKAGLMTFILYKKKWDPCKNDQAAKKIWPLNAWVKKSCEIKKVVTKKWSQRC